MGNIVWTGGMNQGLHGHKGTLGGIGTAIEMDGDLAGHDGPIFSGACFVVQTRSMAQVGADDRLLAIVGNHHRFAGTQGSHRSQAAYLRGYVIFSAERAAGVGLDYLNSGSRQVQVGRDVPAEMEW